MIHYKLVDVVKEISERENNPSTSIYERFVGLEHYVSGEVEIKKYGSTANLNSAMKVFHSGDILVARRNVYLKRASVVFFDGLTSGDSIVLRAKDNRIGKLLPFVLNTQEFWDYADKYSDGTMSKRLSPKVLLQYEFDLPDENEQNSLSDILWGATDTKSAYVMLLNQTNELEKSKFIEMFGDPIENDRGWKTEPLSMVAPETVAEIPEADKYWWLNLDMVEPNSGKLINKVWAPADEIGSSTSTFDDTMVLYSKLRPYLNKVIVPDGCGYATTELVAMRPDETKLNKFFLSSLLRGDEFVKYANDISGGAQMPRMPMKALRQFPCILPPIELQEEFVSFVECCENSRNEIVQSIENINALVTAMIKQSIAE